MTSIPRGNDIRFDTLATVSENHSATRPDDEAIVFGDRRWTWARFHDAVLRTVAALRAAGLADGDRIAFLGYNSDRYVILLQACYRAGIVIAPLNWRLAPPEIAYLLADSAARLLVADPEFLPLVDQVETAARPARIIATETVAGGPQAFDAWIASHAPDAAAPAIDDASLALLLYTSGTTGLPKGAELTQRNILSGFADSVNTGESWGSWNRETVVMLATPIFHIGGTGWVTQALLGGARTVVLPRPEVGGMVDAIPRHGVTKLFAVPAMLAMILDDPAAIDADFSSVRHLLYGASPIPLDVLRRSMRKFPNAGFVQLYGATETTGVATWLPAADHHPDGTPRMASCGKPYAGTAIRILGEGGETLPPHGIGEIAIRSGSVMRGYLNRPDANEAALSDGWYRTGDAGFVDEDGYLYIHDRVKDMIVSGGENIYPAEIERILGEHPAVRDCAVIGVPDSRWGEAAKAVVTLHPDSDATAEELRDFLRGRIAGFKIPKTVDFIAELPRTPSGKILKRELRLPYWPAEGRQVA